MLKKLLYEPLVHFLFLGALLFLFYSFSSQNEEEDSNIIISKERVEQLISQWGKESLRVPTAEEKKDIIDKEIYEIVLYKEALKIGLDNNDVDMRGHLAKKMEFIIYDSNETDVPSDAVLKEFMQENPKNYVEEAKIHFLQSMMGTSKKVFEKEYTLTAFEVSSLFGRTFSEVLFTLETDEKVYKLESTYGVHEVQVVAKLTGELKDFSKMKEKVKDDYLRGQREEKNSVLYEALKSQYSISIEEK